MGDGAGARVLGVEAGDGHRGVAVEVLLEVDAALGEDGALELGQGGVELGRQAVLQHEPREDVAVGRHGQELGGPRVDVGGVEAAGLEEDARRRDAQAGQDGEVGARGQVDLAPLAGRDGRVGGRVEVELEAGVPRRDFLLDVLEPGDRVVGREELGDDAAGRDRVGNGRRVARHARGVAGSGAAGGSTPVPVTTAGIRRAAHGGGIGGSGESSSDKE